MAVGIRPGVYKQEIDNSITPAIGGLGGIGIPAKLEKGEIGVALSVAERDSLMRVGGKPIVGFNLEDYAYIDNVFYYTGNVILSRVEDIAHTYNTTKARLTMPCENAQSIVYPSGVGINCNNKFNMQGVMKELPTTSTERSAAWTDFLTTFLTTSSTGDNPDAVDFSILIKNSLEDIQTVYENAVDSASRKLYSGLINLVRDGDGEFDTNSDSLLKNFNDGSLIVQKSGNNITALAKITNLNKAVTIPYSSPFPATGRWQVGDRVFLIDREVAPTDGGLSAGTYVIDEDGDTPYTEVGIVTANGDDEVTIKYTTSYTFSDGDCLIALNDDEIDASDGSFEREQILNLLESFAVNQYLGYEYGEEPADNSGYIIDFDDSAVTESLVFNYVNLLEGDTDIIDGSANTDVVCYSNFTIVSDVTIDVTTASYENEVFRTIAKTPGRWADREDVEIMICPMNEIDGVSMFDEYAAQYFDFSPEVGVDTTYALDQFAYIVWVDGSIVERYIASVNPEAKTSDGSSKYFDDLINNSTQYAYVTVNPDFIDQDNYVFYVGSETNNVADYVPQIVKLLGGNSSTYLYALRTTNEVADSVQWGSVQSAKEALRVFENKTNVAIDYIADSAFAGQPQIKDYIIDICVDRGDCVALVGPKSTAFQGVVYPNEGYDVLGDYTDWISGSSDNQYVAFIANTKKVYDSFNDSYVWISCSSDGVGLNSRVDRLQERWNAAAGPRRGVLTNVIKLGWYPNDTYREYMTKDRFNPVIFVEGEGNMIYDTMSMCSLNSDLSELYNRKTLNYLQVNTERYLRKILFEFNDEETRSSAVDALEPFFRSVYNRRGLAEPALIQCDSKNNPPDVIGQYMMYVDIILKLQRVAKRIVARYRVNAQGTTLEFVTEG